MFGPKLARRVARRRAKNEGGFAMKTKILGLLAVGLLSGPMTATAAFISYAASVTDFSSPSTFGFVFGSPIAPITGLASFSFAGSFTLTDAAGDGVSISNGGILPEFWRLRIGNPVTTIDDVGGVTNLIGIGPHSFTSSGTFDCASIGQCTWMQIEVAFTGSGGGDQILSSGTFNLNPASVPEPGTLALLGLGLAGLGLSRRRKTN
jgi:hypothetical protein